MFLPHGHALAEKQTALSQTVRERRIASLAP
jgi:hypothetical protein